MGDHRPPAAVQPATDGPRPGDVPVVRYKRTVLALLASVQFILMAAMTIAVVSLPAMRDDLAISPAQASWVITAYGVTFGGVLLLGGRLADLVGRKRLFLLGIVGFSAASLLCALAWHESVLVAGRALQGLGGAFTAPAAMSLVTTVFAGPRERFFALGVWTAVGAAGATLGNVVGGLLTSTVGWRWIFVVNIPVGVVAAVGGLLLFPAIATAGRTRIDVLGALSVTLGLALLIFGMGVAPELGLASAGVSATLLGSGMLLALFVLRQRRVPHALVPLALFRTRASFAFVLILVAGLANMGPYYLGSIVLQDHLGYSALLTGLAFVPWAGLMAVVSQVLSGHINTLGPRYVMCVSFVLAAAGTAWMAARLDALTFGTGVLPAFLLLGLGAGGILVGGMITGMTALPGHAQGLAAGVANAAQQVGAAVSIAIVVTIAAARTQALQAMEPTVSDGSLAGIELALWVTAAVGLAAGVASLVVLPRRLPVHAPPST